MTIELLGVWASSAPLPSIVDFDQFKEATGLAYRTVGGDACYEALEFGFDTMHDMVDAGQWDELTETFYLCDPLEPEDVPHFFSLMAEIYAILPQFELYVNSKFNIFIRLIIFVLHFR